MTSSDCWGGGGGRRDKRRGKRRILKRKGKKNVLKYRSREGEIIELLFIYISCRGRNAHRDVSEAMNLEGLHELEERFSNQGLQ